MSVGRGGDQGTLTGGEEEEEEAPHNECAPQDNKPGFYVSKKYLLNPLMLVWAIFQNFDQYCISGDSVEW